MKGSDHQRRQRARLGRVLPAALLLLALGLTYARAGSEQVYLVRDINPGPYGSIPEWLTAVDGMVFFGAIDSEHGWDLWKSDGSPEGTRLVKEVYPGPPTSRIHQLTAVDDTLFFTGDDGVHGKALWKSDGTAAGTVLVRDFDPVPYDETPLWDLTAMNGTLFFTANEGTGDTELWKSDGTTEGTVEVKDICPGDCTSLPSLLMPVKDTLYFSAFGAGNGLWKSDGTARGTELVKEIKVGGEHGAWDYYRMLAGVGNTLFLSADDGVKGTELWKSDGTEGGTVLVKDINPDKGHSNPMMLIDVDGTLFFRADDGVHGAELWKSDGTAQGTVLVKDISSGRPGSGLKDPIAVDGMVYFWADDGIHGAELWKSDGTKTGTMLVKDINKGGSAGYPELLPHLDPWSLAIVEKDGILFFPARDATHGTELWMSDGTKDGTVMVSDIHLSDSSYPSFLTKANNKILFRADDGTRGHELWSLANFEHSAYVPIVLRGCCE